MSSAKASLFMGFLSSKSKSGICPQQQIPRKDELKSPDFRKPCHVEPAKPTSCLAETTQHFLWAICKGILYISQYTKEQGRPSGFRKYGNGCQETLVRRYNTDRKWNVKQYRSTSQEPKTYCVKHSLSPTEDFELEEKCHVGCLQNDSPSDR